MVSSSRNYPPADPVARVKYKRPPCAGARGLSFTSSCRPSPFPSTHPPCSCLRRKCRHARNESTAANQINARGLLRPSEKASRHQMPRWSALDLCLLSPANALPPPRAIARCCPRIPDCPSFWPFFSSRNLAFPGPMPDWTELTQNTIVRRSPKVPWSGRALPCNTRSPHLCPLPPSGTCGAPATP